MFIYDFYYNIYTLSVNIGGSLDDIFYRYKRDKIIISKENKNGGQIKLVNLDIICQQLHTSVKDLTKYIQKNLAISNIKNNIIQANVDAEKIENIINKYIQEYISMQKMRIT